MVFGAGGQVGRELIAAASLLGAEILGLTHAEADICDAPVVTEAIASYAPTSVVNAAAYTAVDQAEGDADRAFRVNRDGAAALAAAASEADIPFIHISTDYVFDGQARVPYAETDAVNPQGAYARSKEAGERSVRSAHARHLILRTAWVYGPSGTNFLTTMLRLGAEREELVIVDDQSGCPTSSADIAATILTMAAQAERPGFANWGTYHYVGADVVTWYGFAGMIFEGAARFGRKTPRLRPITTAEYPTPAARPGYSVLGTAKLKRVFGIQPRPLRDSLAECLERVFDQRKEGAA
jgi:dTDP-4-dehydrorhamnose reductase